MLYSQLMMILDLDVEVEGETEGVWKVKKSSCMYLATLHQSHTQRSVRVYPLQKKQSVAVTLAVTFLLSDMLAPPMMWPS